MIMPLAGAISLVCDNCVRDRSTMASAARNWARAAAMSSGVLRTWSIDRLGECGLHLIKPCVAGIERHACIIEKLLRGRVARGEPLLPLEGRLCVGERGLRGGNIGPRLVDLFRPRAGQQHVKLRLRGVAPCDGEIEGALVGGRVELAIVSPCLTQSPSRFGMSRTVPSALNNRSTWRISTLPYSVPGVCAPVICCTASQATPMIAATATTAKATRLMRLGPGRGRRCSLAKQPAGTLI
jgi:hypothetical protein